MGAILLTINATNNIVVAPVRTGIKINRKFCQGKIGWVVTASKAVAPPGGWVVSVNCIATIAVATAKEQAVEWSNRSIAIRTVQPHIALITWPPIKFRGWANGERGAPNINTAEAPNEPIRNDKSCLDQIKIWFYYYWI